MEARSLTQQLQKTPPKWLTDTQMAILDKISNIAPLLLARDGSLSPIAFLTIGKNVHMLPLRMANDEEKDLSAQAIKVLAGQVKADMVCMVSEVWIGKPIPEGIDPSTYTRPSEDPEKEEAVMLNINTKDHSAFALALITREGGTPIAAPLGWHDIEDPAENANGRFTNFLELTSTDH